MGQEDMYGYIFLSAATGETPALPRGLCSLRHADAVMETKRPGFNPALKHITTNENYC